MFKRIEYPAVTPEIMSMGSLLVITGPTAVGKTELCLSLAEHYNIPIINADSRQIYRDLRIGTASPTEDQLHRARHYFVGSLALSDYYNAAMYEHDVIELCKTLSKQNANQHLPQDSLLKQQEKKHTPFAILTGGSMMYIDAVCNGIDDIPTVTEDIRQHIKARLETEGLDILCEQLRELDPEHYEIVDHKNTRRVVHALEICLQTGKTYTSYRTSTRKQRPFEIVKIGLNRPREELYERINNRVDIMMEHGLLAEAERLYPLRHLNALNTVGYKEMFDYLDNKYLLSEAVERIKGNTRRYARKQLTWFKRDENIAWFHPDNYSDIVSYIDNHIV